jgi:hypothetical protein
MGVDLNTGGVVMDDGNVDKADVVKQDLLSIGYVVGDWCENVARSFRNRFDGNEAKHTIVAMAQCVDLRMFVMRSHAPLSSFDAYLEARVFPILLSIHTLMVEKGKIHLTGFYVCWRHSRHRQTQCTKMLSPSTKVTNLEKQYRWHADKEGKTTVSGTVIQEGIMTKPASNKLCSWFILMYIHCVLKISNEVVAEGMCSVVAKRAPGTRGLI